MTKRIQGEGEIESCVEMEKEISGLSFFEGVRTF